MSRELTLAEVRDEFLYNLWAKVHYWENVPNYTSHMKLEGLVHSILVMLDGMSSCPGFQIIPDPHETEQEFHEEEGTDWWPSEGDIRENVMMHDEWYGHSARKVFGSAN